MGNFAYQSYCGAQIFDAASGEGGFVASSLRHARRASRVWACRDCERNPRRHTRRLRRRTRWSTRPRSNVRRRICLRTRGEDHDLTPKIRFHLCKSLPRAAIRSERTSVRENPQRAVERCHAARPVPHQVGEDEESARHRRLNRSSLRRDRSSVSPPAPMASARFSARRHDR